MSGPSRKATAAGSGRERWAARLRPVFWIVLAGVLIVSAWPQPPDVPYIPSDKVQHALTFLCLSLLAAAAYPRLSLIKLALGLALFGALIEAVQAIPMLNRHTEFLDWVADVAAVAVVVAALAIRRALRKRA